MPPRSRPPRSGDPALTPVAPLPLSYRFEARCIAIHDGDTVSAFVRLGFRVLVEVNVRVFGINCPELKVNGLDNPAGEAAHQATVAWMAAAAAGTTDSYPLIIDSLRYVSDDKYGGRADCRVVRKCDGRDLATDLLTGGFAVVLRV